MIFNRPPRIQKPLSAETVRIPTAPAAPSKPESSNWLTIGLPVGALILSVVLLLVFSGSGASSTNYLLFLPMMLVSYLSAILVTKGQKKKYQQEVEESRTKFRNELKSTEDTLIRLKNNEDTIRKETDPEIRDCLIRADQSDPRLGERRPEDADFLKLRLGLGEDKPVYKIENPNQQIVDEFKQEFEFIQGLIDRYSVLKNIPIQARLNQTGSIGICGNRQEVVGMARAITCQLTVHHWPEEVQMAVALTAVNVSDWSWASSLPHYFPALKHKENTAESNDRQPSDRFLAVLEEELNRREQQIELQKSLRKNDSAVEDHSLLPRLIVFFDYLPEGFSHPAIQLLLQRGPQLGVYGIFLTSHENKVPGECGAVINVAAGYLTYSESGALGYKLQGQPDDLNLQQANKLARSLAAVSWPSSDSSTSPPETITFLEMFEAKRVDDLPMEDWWNGNSPYGYMRAPIGRLSPTTNLIFDLNDKDGAHGPHGLLGGMTGSGKSEVLKAIILALAVTHHPYDLNFALIDFKGGAAFNELAKLPHTVGVVTDIESNATFAERVIQALNGEIERRKKVLEEARAAFGFGRSHIDEYRKQPVRKPMPRLLIIFDEFAEFKQRNPDESKKLISIARQGRSLGVHLVLATQNISAAVDPEILQNSNFRICLKVAEPQDSVQMVGIPDAINLSRGRGYFLSNSRMLFQSAFSGAIYDENARSQSRHIVKIWPDGRREMVEIADKSQVKTAPANPVTQASVIIDAINNLSQKLHLKRPPSVWPEALAEKIFVPDILNSRYSGGWNSSNWEPIKLWDNLDENQTDFQFPVLGLVDQPFRQRQIPLQSTQAQGGNLLIFGSSGSGKSTLLRTLVTSLALMHTPSEVQFYIMDFGGQSSLKILETFPHVGSVVTHLETERTERLVQLVQQEIHRRNNLMREVRVDNWRDYNTSCKPEDKFPVLYLLIDNFREFKNKFDNEFVEEVTTLMSGGQSAGLYLAVATSLQNDLPVELFANINQRLTFLQADTTEYFRIVGTPSEAKLQEDAAKGIRPGRGLSRGNPPEEFQAALPVYGMGDKEQTDNLLLLAEKMRTAWKGPLPGPVNTLPYHAVLQPEIACVERSGYETPLGLDFINLQPIGFNLPMDGPAFLIGGVSRLCGKTSLLQTWLLGLSSCYTPRQVEVILVDFHTRSMSALRRLPIVKHYVGSRSALDEVLEEINAALSERQRLAEEAYNADPDHFDPIAMLSSWPHILVMIDDYERLYQVMGGENPLLAECIQQSEGNGCSFAVSAKLSDLPNSFSDHFAERLRKSGCGILLGGSEGIDEYNNTRRPAGSVPMGLRPGRGYRIVRGQTSMIQALAYWGKDEPKEDALKRWREFINNKTADRSKLE